jgi:hypothetical protein
MRDPGAAPEDREPDQAGHRSSGDYVDVESYVPIPVGHPILAVGEQ